MFLLYITSVNLTWLIYFKSTRDLTCFTFYFHDILDDVYNPSPPSTERLNELVTQPNKLGHCDCDLTSFGTGKPFTAARAFSTILSTIALAVLFVLVPMWGVISTFGRPRRG